MNILDDFKSKLESLEGESKNELLGAFGEVSNVFNETIKRRDSVSETNRTLSDKLKSVASTLELGEDFTADDIAKILNHKQGDTQKLKEELALKIEEKYRNDILSRDEQLKALQESMTDVNSKYENMLLQKSVFSTDEFNKTFVDDKEARESIIFPKIKESLILQDGQVFVRDSITGGIARGLDGKPKDPTSIIESLSKQISPLYLKKQTADGGMEMHKQKGSSDGTRRSQMTHKQKAEYIKANGQDAYLKLPN